jgi:thiol-disulfide isomerase/thioredoxin
MYNLNNPSLILFYADWCGHCKTFMPTWGEFKTKINTKKYNIVEIESQNPFTNRIQGLQGYPSLYYIINDKAIEYNGGRDVQSLEMFLKKNKN